MDFIFPALMPIVAFLMALIITITYIGGRVFRIPQWEAYFNIELYNLVLAIIILGVAFAFFESSNIITHALLCKGYSDPADCPSSVMEASKSFVNTIVNKGVLPMYKDLLIIEAGTTLSSSFMFRLGIPVWSPVVKIKPGMDAILAITRTISFGLLMIYASLSIQYIGLSLIEVGMPILLSLGLILFILPPTRDAGTFLIAFAFAFQTIFPFTYALNKVILDDMSLLHYGHPYTAYMREMSLFGMNIPGSSMASPFLIPVVETAYIGQLGFEFFIPFINAMAHLALISLFLPAFSLLLTIAFINALTKFLMGKI